ncbi:MAG: translation initiation factor IF-3 [Christensenellaceae bacterium]|nr:translation initiation factor IF-3 [Christensenellaceae bacterium]
MINEEIKDRQVRVIDSNGEQLGVFPIAEALAIAEQKQLDLVKIADKTDPPVCKLLNYDKHRYEQSKFEREMRKKQKVVMLKEVQISVTIEENDLLTKVRRAIKFLENGDKVKVVIRFRGRQIVHADIATNLMKDFANRASDVSTIQREPLIEGRNMIMILAPKAEKQSFAEKAEVRRKERNN